MLCWNIQILTEFDLKRRTESNSICCEHSVLYLASPPSFLFLCLHIHSLHIFSCQPFLSCFPFLLLEHRIQYPMQIWWVSVYSWRAVKMEKTTERTWRQSTVDTRKYTGREYWKSWTMDEQKRRRTSEAQPRMLTWDKLGRIEDSR